MNPATLRRIDVTNETHRMGFHALAASMAAFCAHELGHPFSDVRPAVPTASQVATPCVSGDGYGAVHANASKVLAAGGGNLFPMNTVTTTAPDIAGMFARKVSAITGLSESEIYRLHSSDMGAPRHFRYVSAAGGGYFYTADGISRLVEVLHAEGRKAEGTMLARSLAEIRTPAPRPRAPAGRNVRGSWMAAHEARQEEAAA